VIDVEKCDELACAGEGLASAGADVLDHAAELFLARLFAVFGSGWDLDHECLHRLLFELDRQPLQRVYRGAEFRLDAAVADRCYLRP